MSHCVYCGLPTPRALRVGHARYLALACVGHRDLPTLDPAYGLATQLAARSYPALMLADRAPAALTTARRE